MRHRIDQVEKELTELEEKSREHDAKLEKLKELYNGFKKKKV